MMDKREQILARLRQILDTVPGIASDGNGNVRGAGRNRDHLTDLTARPAVILYDGNEEVSPVDGAAPPLSAVQTMRLTPEIVVYIGDTTENVGTQFSAFRAYLLSTILTDNTLVDLCGNARSGSGGKLDIQYEGCEFAAETGRQREGMMTLRLAFIYAFRVSDLV